MGKLGRDWKSMKKILIIFLFLSVPLLAQEIKVNPQPDLDGWSIMHFSSGTVGYGAFRLMGIKPVGSLILVGVSAYVHEIIVDGMQNDWLFPCDSRGADFWADPWVTIGGACFGCLLECAFKIINARVYIVKKGVGVTIELN